MLVNESIKRKEHKNKRRGCLYVLVRLRVREPYEPFTNHQSVTDHVIPVKTWFLFYDESNIVWKQITIILINRER